MTRKLLVSFAVTMTVFAGIALVLFGRTAQPSSVCITLFTLNTPGSFTWDSAPWSPPTASSHIPGTVTGDCVSINGGTVSLGTETISLADITTSSGSFGPTGIVVANLGSITQTAGTFTNSGTYEVDSGGVTTFGSPTAQSVGGTIKILGGTVAINSPWTLFGQIQHSGGTLNGNGTLDVNGGLLKFDGAVSAMTVNMINPINVRGFGNANYNSTNAANFLSLNTPVNVQGSSAFFANADAPLNGSGPIALVTDTTGSFAGGALQRSVGASDIVISTPVNNDGTVVVTNTSGVGGMVLAGGGTHNGTFSAGSQTITFSGTHHFNGGSVSATAKITGSSTVINVDAPGGLQMSNVLWNGGTIAGSTPMKIQGSSEFGTSANPLTLNGQIQNKGALEIGAGNNFNMGATALLETSTTLGSLELIGDVKIPITSGVIRIDASTYMESDDGVLVVNDPAPEPVTFSTSPRPRPRSRSRAVNLSAPGANVGAFVDLNGGNLIVNSTNPLHLSGGGNGAASSYIQLFGGSREISFDAGAFTLNKPQPIGASPPGTIVVNGGAVNFAGTSTGTTCSLVNNTACIVDNLYLLSGQIFGSDITFNLGFTWQGGTLGGASPLIARIPSPQVIDATNLLSLPVLNNATVELDGVMNVNPSSNSLNLSGGSIINIKGGTGVLDAQGDGIIFAGAGGCTINNFNILKKSVGTTGTRFDCAVNNAGTISSQSGAGTFIINNGGTQSAGTLSTATANDLIDVANGIFTISGGSITGPGPTRTTISGEIDVPISIVIPAANFAMINGTRGGLGELQATNFKWSGGTMLGGGTTTVLGTGVLDGLSPMVLSNATLKNNGATIAYSPANALDIQSGGVLNGLNGTWDFQNNTAINGSVAGGSIINGASHTFKKSNFGVTNVNVPITNNGTLQSATNGGRIRLASSGTSALGGTIDLSAGTSSELDLANGTFNMAGATVTGPGSVNISTGALNVNSTETIPVLIVGGTSTTTVNSPNQLLVTTLLSIDGGVLTGNGSTTASGAGTGLTYGASNPALLTGGHTLTANTNTNYGASNTSFLTIGSSSTFVNGAAGTFTAGGNSIIGGSTGLFTNNGTFSKSGGGTTTRIDSVFNHNGTLSIAANAILNLAGGGTSVGTINNSGFLDFGGGTYFLNSGTSTTIGGGFKVIAGTVDSSINLNLTNFGLLGGTFTGSGNVAFSNAQWSGGTLKSTSPSVTATSSGNMTIDGSAGAMNLDSRNLINNGGTINYSSATNSLSLTSGAVITNTSGTFDVKGDAAITGGSIVNSGTFRKSAGSSTSLPSITNSGIVSAQAGTMAFSGYSQSAGSTQFSGGAISSANPVTLGGGLVQGNGTFTAASFTNSGASIQPGFGAATGGVTFAGAYSQSGGTIDVELGGTTPNAQYDQVFVTGAANITGGVLNATLINGFLPGGGNTFDVFNFASKSPTDFSSKVLPSNWNPGATMNATYLPAVTPTKLQLQAVVTSADMAVTQSIAGTVFHNQNATFNITVTNNGTSNATNVQLSNTISGGSFVSATPSQGTCTPTTCSLGTIATGNSVTVALVLNANGTSPLKNIASVTANEFDNNTANNTFTASASINPVSDLSVAVTDSPDPVNAGANVTYSIVTTNNGPDPAGSTITMNLSVSGAASIVSASGTGVTCNVTSPSSRQCFISSIAFPGSNTITLVAQAGAAGPISITATSVFANDTTNSNNTGTQATAVTPIVGAADVSVTKNGPASVISGGSITYTVAVTNIGTLAANGVVLNDPTPARLTNPAVGSAACTSLPCNIGTLNPNQTVNVTLTYDVTPAGPGTITNTATVTSSNDANAVNDSSTVVTQIGCNTAIPQLVNPANNTSNVPTSGTLQWIGTGAASYKVYLGIAGVGCTTTTPAGSTSTTSLPYSNLTPNTDYEWRVEATTPNCATTISACGHFKTASSTNGCTTPPPVLVAPANGATVASPVHFSWNSVANASNYDLFVSNNGGAATLVASGPLTTADITIPDGPGTWFVIANVPTCGSLQSASRTFNTCNLPAAPIVSLQSESLSGQTYAVQWESVVGSVKYEIDEATDAAFTNPTTQTISTTPGNQQPVGIGFTKTAGASAQPFFYRVRAFTACGQTFGPYSITVRVIITPLPGKNERNTNVNVAVGSTTKVIEEIFIPGQPGETLQFTARTDQLFITVTPPSGVLTPAGVSLTLTADPTNLPNGTFTGTLIVTLNPIATANGAHTNVTTVVNIPVSISLVTPVTPTTNGVLPAGALIIPAVGHLDGIDSHWQSDIRVTNAGFSKQTYSLTFTPEDTSKGVKTTQITIDAGGTTALDDIVRNWYGIGQLGDGANGTLELHPVTSGAKPLQATPGQTITTVASSRTYNVSNAGTLGQYIPAVPFANFIGKAAPNALATVLSLQQIAQSAAYRTNFGVVEASGQPADVVMSVFNTAGQKLKDIPISLKAFEQKQLNQMLATNGITNLADGRVEVKVANGSGKITAFASVVDNFTQDPQLISGVALNGILSNKYVMPGAAALNNGFVNWRTDMRIFNAGTSAQNATMTFYPLSGSGSPIVKTTSINAGEVKTLDDVVQTTFGANNLGGAVHITTPTDSSLVVSGRTYDKTTSGTFGQFISAITPNDAIGLGARALQILQVEDSSRFRTNVGIAEVSGKPVTVEVAINLPDSRVTPLLQMTLAANEYRQEPIIQELGLGNVYNARVTVRVISGDGKITAYGSVIDMTTQDPTLVPAQ